MVTEERHDLHFHVRTAVVSDFSTSERKAPNKPTNDEVLATARYITEEVKKYA